jgi:hypothetical protein
VQLLSIIHPICPPPATQWVVIILLSILNMLRLILSILSMLRKLCSSCAII